MHEVSVSCTAATATKKPLPYGKKEMPSREKRDGIFAQIKLMAPVSESMLSIFARDSRR